LRPIDAGEETLRDGAQHDDAAQDPPRPSSWDGGLSPPELHWTLPDCAVAHGVIARNVLTPDPKPNPALKLLAAALSGERLALSFHEKSDTWGEQRSDGLMPFAGQPSGQQVKVPVSPRKLAFANDHWLGLSFAPVDYRALLVEQSSTAEPTTHALDALPYAGGSLFLNPVLELRDYGWAQLTAQSDGSVAIVGRWNQTGGSAGDREGIARVTLDAARNVLGSAEWYDVASDPKYSTPPVLQAFLTSSSSTAAVLQWGFGGTLAAIEIVVHGASGGAHQARLALPDPFNRGAQSVTAAIDGDTIACGWLAQIRDADYASEVTAEVTLAAGAVAKAAEPIGPQLHGDDGLIYLSHPGGGIDVLKYGDAVPGYEYDELFARDNPLALYLAVPRPLRFNDREFLRVGAGATVVDALAIRDDERIAVIWRERGPTTSTLASEANTVQGIYYAVLACDG
jgi:hypothetical protein